MTPTSPTPRVELVYALWCDHCGCEAIEKNDDAFSDGEGGSCASCGFPGVVSVDDSGDDDATAYWNMSEADDARCNQDDCEECGSLDLKETR